MIYDTSAWKLCSTALLQPFQRVCSKTSFVVGDFRKDSELIPQVRCHCCHTYGSSPDLKMLLHNLFEIPLNDRGHLQAKTKGTKPCMGGDPLCSAGPDRQIFLDHFEQSHLGCISPAIVLAWLSIDTSKTCSEEMSVKVAGLLFLSSHPSEGAVTGQWQG